MKSFDWLVERPIAHRGLHDAILPENSMAAFRAAVESGYNIEIDVHITSDGKIVVHHDSNLKRVCGVNLVIERHTFAEVASHPLKGSDQYTPLLTELLDMIQGRVGLLIEFKNNNPFSYKLERETLAILEKYDGPVCLQSFNPFSVEYLRANSDFPCGQLVTWRILGKRCFLMNFMGKLKVTAISGPVFVAYDIRDLDKDAVAKWRVKHPAVKFITWTVRSEEDLAKARKFADNVIFENFIPSEERSEN